MATETPVRDSIRETVDATRLDCWMEDLPVATVVAASNRRVPERRRRLLLYHYRLLLSNLDHCRLRAPFRRSATLVSDMSAVWMLGEAYCKSQGP